MGDFDSDSRLKHVDNFIGCGGVMAFVGTNGFALVDFLDIAA